MGAGWALQYDLTRCRNEIWVGIPRGSFFATFAFFAAKHQSRVGSFSAERGNAFYTIYMTIICVGLRSGCFRTGVETGATNPPRLAWTGMNICFRDTVSGVAAKVPRAAMFLFQYY